MEALISIFAGTLVDAIGKAIPKLVKSLDDGEISGDELRQIGLSMIPGLFGTIAKPQPLSEPVTGEISHTGVSVTLNFPNVVFSAEDIGRVINAIMEKNNGGRLGQSEYFINPGVERP